MIDYQSISARLEKLREYVSYLKSYQKNSIAQIKKDYTLQGAIWGSVHDGIDSLRSQLK